MIFAPASKGDWKDFLVPAAYTNIGKLINEEPRPNLSLTKLPSWINRRERQDNVENNNKLGSSDQEPLADSRKDESDSPVDNEHSMPTDPSGIPENSSPANHIEYIAHRNLEHILSVCSIPLEPVGPNRAVPVALTCGDMSFHRITASSSL